MEPVAPPPHGETTQHDCTDELIGA